MFRRTYYHCSPVADLQPEISIERTLCVADDADAAATYLRGDARHYLYEVSWDRYGASIASEADLVRVATSLGLRVREGYEYEAAKHLSVRQALVAEGYDGVTYGDPNEGCTYQCIELYSRPESLRVELVREIERPPPRVRTSEPHATRTGETP